MGTCLSNDPLTYIGRIDVFASLACHRLLWLCDVRIFNIRCRILFDILLLFAGHIRDDRTPNHCWIRIFWLWIPWRCGPMNVQVALGSFGHFPNILMVLHPLLYEGCCIWWTPWTYLNSMTFSTMKSLCVGANGCSSVWTSWAWSEIWNVPSNRFDAALTYLLVVLVGAGNITRICRCLLTLVGFCLVSMMPFNSHFRINSLKAWITGSLCIITEIWSNSRGRWLWSFQFPLIMAIYEFSHFLKFFCKLITHSFHSS